MATSSNHQLIAWFSRELDDAAEIIVPLEYLNLFVTEIIEARFEQYLEDRRRDENVLMAGIGIFMLMTSPADETDGN